MTWDLGPLRGIIASPVFHRWHHSKDREAWDKNFAGLLPLWDIDEGVRELESDDAVELLESLDEEDREEVLEKLPPSERDVIERSLEYPENSAGRRMQTEFIAVPPDWTAQPPVTGTYEPYQPGFSPQVTAGARSKIEAAGGTVQEIAPAAPATPAAGAD